VDASARQDRGVAVLTGGSSGIGRWIALGLARAGLHLVMIARDPARAAATRAWLGAQVAGAEPEIVTADLSLLAAARAAAAAIAARHSRITLLVNNAGLIAPRRILTAEGHELVLAVNHLAPFVLTRALLPALEAAAPARVVNIGSTASDHARIDPDDLEGARGWGVMRAYGQSKLALMMASLDWAEQLAGTGVTCNVVHPGLVATEIARHLPFGTLAWRLGRPFMLSPRQGADTPLYVALAPDLATVSGRYFKRRRQVPTNPLAQDRALRARVWAATARLVGEAVAPVGAAAGEGT